MKKISIFIPIVLISLYFMKKTKKEIETPPPLQNKTVILDKDSKNIPKKRVLKEKKQPKQISKIIYNIKRNLHQNLESDIKSFVKIQESKLLKYAGKKRNVLQVLIKLTDKNNQRSSYNAYIDPSTGKVIKTWNHTISEHSESFKFDITDAKLNQ
ncbi:MAG: hypothetical protein N4A33_00835 [Bacteriovoracaceae bacterium]|jgi:predicted small secreted protein|nr:hypothetical protein [Bacteriovoracaceae bacterium]